MADLLFPVLSHHMHQAMPMLFLLKQIQTEFFNGAKHTTWPVMIMDTVLLQLPTEGLHLQDKLVRTSLAGLHLLSRLMLQVTNYGRDDMVPIPPAIPGPL